MKYRSEIDGLRAIAVVPVILFHAGIPAFDGGFVGVDIFFVISGYLITTILLADLEHGRFSLVRFYERRARRILPALLFVIACCTPFAWLWMLTSQLKAYGDSLVSIALFASNILFWRQSGYFAAAAELKPMLHTWSLAVEEQYYLIFPLALLAIWRSNRKLVLPTILAAAAGSLVLAEWGAARAPVAAFFWAPTRFWEILSGSLCAVAIRNYSVPRSEIGGWTGIGLIAVSMIWFTSSTPTPSLWTLLPVGGTALTILFARSDTLAGRFLGLRPFVAIGLVSYSAYLWHQPLLALARIRLLADPKGWLLAGLMAATFVLAIAHYMGTQK